MNSNEDDTSDRLGGFGNAEFFDKDEDAYDGEDTDGLDEHVNDVCGFSLVGATPEEEAEH